MLLIFCTMSQHELVMPKMGESVAEATIIRWVKNEGDYVRMDETILEIATDKVDSEIPSPFEGKLLKKLFKEGEVVQVGKPIAIIGSELPQQTASSTEPSIVQTSESLNKPTHTDVLHPTEQKNVLSTAVHSSGKFFSPLVRSIARQEGISIQELEQLKGSGLGGRVTKSDILAYVEKRKNGTASSTTVPEQTQEKSTTPSPPDGSFTSVPPHTILIQRPAVSVSGEDEIIEMDRMRKIIADNMVVSKHVAPHVTSFVEADVTNLVLWREKVKKEFEKREGEKLTFTPLFIEAMVKAIKDFPMINVSVDQTQTKIIKRKNINVGMATALPSGNLIVPVIKNADQKNLIGLTKAVNDLANRARLNKLQPDEIQGGTITISNVGNFGNVMGTPIIPIPQVAIMAVGTIKKKPAVLETPQGDVIAIRHMMFLSLSYDHRVVDGALGGSFLRRVADYLEQWDINRTF